ncbi:Enoyl-CoA delta isomerase 3 [Erysiphe necator]|uniref:Putative enoyl-hydratase isomerase n=1 Tax=Uncinula necator TaxID=52586 RepID=A0A0B1P308_UNCNE|nr:Enoyl-CoA delta isomerase 3 [Erysiphe necator]KHJ31276.1 putative enoyl- hydratase isomerase [Erysiphe necator]
MDASTPLFVLDIPALSHAKQSASHGNITCTRTLSNSGGPIYLLTFSSPPDNRLVTPFLKSLFLALDILEFSYPHGVVVTTSGVPKFYSNGLNLEHARDTHNFFPESFFALLRRFLTYPMTTIALVNGHAFAAGLMLAMYHDYRVMNPSRGFVCLNELDFGAPLKPAMSSIFRQKLRPDVYRTLVLEAHRFTGDEAFKSGIVDLLGNYIDTVEFIDERKLATKHISGIYGLMKAEMFRETLSYIDEYDIEEHKIQNFSASNQQREADSRKRVEIWRQNTQPKSKL